MADPHRRLDRAFFARPTGVVASDLIGRVLVTDLPAGRTSGRIVETEAYLGPDDPASHAAKRRAGRVTAMGGPPGIAYVYRSYGIHAMLNIVCEPDGQIGAVLIRALEPLSGLDLMRLRRGTDDVRALCAGPGRLCQAMGITLDDHGLDLTDNPRIWLEAGEPHTGGIVAGSRIGITKGLDQPWRYFAAGSRFVSAHRRGEPWQPPA